MTIQITLHLPFLLHQEERQEATTGTRLLKGQRHHHMQSVSITPYLRPYTRPQQCAYIYKAGH